MVNSDITNKNTANGQSICNLIEALEERNLSVIVATTYNDGIASITSDASICCVFVDWTSEEDNADSHSQALKLLQEIRRRNKTVPVLLMAEHACLETLTLETMELANEFIWMQEDTAEFIASRSIALIKNISTSYYHLSQKPYSTTPTVLQNIHGQHPVIRAVLRLPNRRLVVSSLISSAKIFSVPIPELNVIRSVRCSITAAQSKTPKPMLPEYLVPTKAIPF